MDTAIRPATEADMPAIHAIYEREVREDVATFELGVPSPDEMARRRAAVIGAGMPYLVAERAGRVLGYAYAGTYRLRPAYRFTVENSVYVAPEAQGQGIGRLLLTALIEECERTAARQMVAIITVGRDAVDNASVRLHASLGFTRAGQLRSVGWKHGRWHDVLRMQRALGKGDATSPSVGGADQRG